VGYVVAPEVTVLCLRVAAGAAVAWAVWWAARGVVTWRHRRRVVRPMVRALAPVVELAPVDIRDRLIIPAPAGPVRSVLARPVAAGAAALLGSDDPAARVAGRALAVVESRVLAATPGRIVVPVADHWAGRPAQVQELSRIVGQRVGGEWDASTQLRTAPFSVRYTPRPAPPESVLWTPDGQLAAAVAATTQDRPVLGVGSRGEYVNLDFTGEIAHLAASFGTGAGKSSFLRWLTAQFAYHGVREFVVCDVKWVSLAGMEGVPGLHIYRDVEEIWDAIALARAEMDRRYVELLADPKRVFPRMVIILEEQNAFAMESAMRWMHVRPDGVKKALPPVWGDIGLLLLKGRQVNINLISVYQRMTADSCGGGAFRDQYGLKMLSRFSPQAWDTLVGTRPRGVSSAVPGRAIAVLGGLHRNVQIPYISPEDALTLATSGPEVAVPVRVDPCSVADHPVEPLWTLREAVERELIPMTYDAARQARNRSGDLIADGRKGNSDAYTASTLQAWHSAVKTPEVNGG
jgi:hypothetical protein